MSDFKPTEPKSDTSNAMDKKLNTKEEEEKRAALARMAQILQEYQTFVQKEFSDLKKDN